MLLNEGGNLQSQIFMPKMPVPKEISLEDAESL